MRELISVEAGLDADGNPLPRSFWWRGRRYRIVNYGRRWEQANQLHFLVQDERNHTYELALASGEGQWCLLRGPRQFGPRPPRNKA